MKRIVLTNVLVIFFMITNITAQIWSSGLAGHYGIRVIYYANGYYQGNVYNGVAHGLGTFYFQDGTFFHGNFNNGYYHGQGVIVSPYYGYLTGCWNQGNYMGECRTTNSNTSFNRPASDWFQELVEDVRSHKPDKADDYTSVSPEGYKIKKIKPETQMGRTLLGRYRGN
jgi:hypothetical protein